MKADSWPKVVIALFVFCGLAFLAVLIFVMPWGGKDSSDSCPKALDAAEVVMHKAEDALDAVGDAINSFVAGDGAGISEANGRIQELTSAVTQDVADYNRLAAECRGN